MRFARFLIATTLTATAGLALTVSPASAAVVNPFTFVAPGFTGQIWAAPTPAFGGVAVRNDGTVIASRCASANGPLYFFDPVRTVDVDGITSHVQNASVQNNAGCGLLLHPDGYLYSTTSTGLVRLDRANGQFRGQASFTGGSGATNIRSIALDPVTNHITYVASTNDRLLDYDPAENLGRQGASLPAGTTFVDGIHYSADGQFLFISKRQPNLSVIVLRRDGTFVQEVAMTQNPDGLVVHRDGWIAVSTHEGSIVRMTFAGNDYTATPTLDVIASGNRKIDLAGVGPDGCAYMTVDGLVYPDGVTTTENSISRLCGGFLTDFDVTQPDVVAPEIAISRPIEGEELELNEYVAPEFFCADASFVLNPNVLKDPECKLVEGGAGFPTGGDPELGLDTLTPGRKRFTLSSTDPFGNTATKTVEFDVKLGPDMTNPIITLTSPAEGAMFTVGQVVNANYSCADDRELAACVGTAASGSPIDTASVGPKTFTVTATDATGNTTVRTVSYTVATPADTVPPTITITNPIDGASYTQDAVVLAEYGCIDDRAIESCIGSAANGGRINTTTLGTKTFTVTSSDAAGNTATKSVTYRVVLAPDTTKPTVDISSPADGATFFVGDTVTAAYACADDRAIAMCSGTVANGTAIDTSAPGTKTFNVTATDTSGNTTSMRTTYTIVERQSETDPTEWFELGGMGEWRQFYLGFGTAHVWAPTTNPADGRTTIEMQFRDLAGDADWTKIKVRPQTHPEKMVPVSAYIPAGTDTTKWFTVQIPIAAFGPGAFDKLTEIGIYQETEIGTMNIGLGTVRFTGGTEAPFEWFGPTKNNNVIEANHVMGQLVAQRHTKSGADAAVNLNFPNKKYKIYEPVFADITITNTGTVAKSFTVNVELPPSVVYCYGTFSQGEYIPWPGRRHEWKVGVLQPGQTATANVALFPLANNRPLTFIAQADGFGDFDMATVTKA